MRKVASIGAMVAVGATPMFADTNTFDFTTLYSGASAAFTAAATVAGGFLCVKFGAKMVKRAWGWLAG